MVIKNGRGNWRKRSMLSKEGGEKVWFTKSRPFWKMPGRGMQYWTQCTQTRMTRTYHPANLWAELSRVYFPQLCSNLRLCQRSDSLLIDFFKFLRPVQLFPGLDVVDQCIILCTKSSKLDKFQFSNYSESVTRLIMILHDTVVRGHVSLTPPPSPSENPTSLSQRTNLGKLIKATNHQISIPEPLH